MPEDDQKPAGENLEENSASLEEQNSAPDNKNTDQEKSPQGHKRILIGKAFVIGGVAVRVDKIPKKAKGGQGIVIHGLNLKLYDGLALFVAGAWYKPINLHLARIDGQAIEFTLPNFNKILSEGSDIWVRVSSSHFPEASGTLNKYIAYTLKDEEEEETAESKAKKEEEKRKAEKEGKVGGKGLGALAEASVANVLGNLAEPFLPASLKKGNALNDAKSALKSGDKNALKDAVKKSAELKDLDGLKGLLKEAKDSESEKLIRESISDLENKTLVPEKLDSSETAKIIRGDKEGELKYIDDDSEEVQQAQNKENSARLDLRQQQEGDRGFAEKFEEEPAGSKDVGDYRLPNLSAEQQHTAHEIAESIAAKTFQNLNNQYSNFVVNPDSGYDPLLANISTQVLADIESEYFDKVELNPELKQQLFAFLGEEVSKQVMRKIGATFPQRVEEYYKKTDGGIPADFRINVSQVESEGGRQVSTSGGGGQIQTEVSAQVSGGAQGEIKVQGGSTEGSGAQSDGVQMNGGVEGGMDIRASGPVGSGQVSVSGSTPAQGFSGIDMKGTVSTEESAGQAPSGIKAEGEVSGKTEAQISGKSEVNIEGKSGLNLRTEEELKTEREGAVAGTGSQVLSQLDITGAQPGVQEQDRMQVNIKGKSGLNRQVEAELKEETSGAVAGAGSEVSKKIDLNIRQSVSADDNISTGEVGESAAEPSGESEKEKSLETETSVQGKEQTAKPTGDLEKPASQTAEKGVLQQKQDIEAAQVQSDVSADVGKKPEPEQIKSVPVAPPSQGEGVLPSNIPPRTPTKEPVEPKQPLDLPKAERKYPRRPFKDTRSLNDLMSAAIRGREDLSKHPSAWQTVKRIAEKKLARPSAGVGAKSTKDSEFGAPSQIQGPTERGTDGVAGGDKVGGKPAEDQRHEGVSPDSSREGVSKPETPVGESAQKPTDQEPEAPKQEQGESPVSRVASKISSEPGVDQAASQATSKVWWYGFDTAAAVFFSGLDFLIGAIVMDAYWIFGHRKDKKIFPLKTWQKAVTIFANIAPLIYITLIFIILLFVGCETPIVNKIIGDDICKSVKSTTSNLDNSGSQIASQGGPVTTINWTPQITQIAGENSINPCVLRAVIQKRGKEVGDLNQIAQKMKVAVARHGQNLEAAYSDKLGLNVAKNEAKDLATLYNICLNFNNGN